MASAELQPAASSRQIMRGSYRGRCAAPECRATTTTMLPVRGADPHLPPFAGGCPQAQEPRLLAPEARGLHHSGCHLPGLPTVYSGGATRQAVVMVHSPGCDWVGGAALRDVCMYHIHQVGVRVGNNSGVEASRWYHHLHQVQAVPGWVSRVRLSKRKEKK